MTSDFVTAETKWLFRGQSDPAWKLDTSYRRYCKANNIDFSIELFMQLLDSFIDIASDFFERDLQHLPLYTKIALAQHHGLPTPFLDWTESPYMAAFFALRYKIGSPNNTPFTIWALQVDKDRLVNNSRNSSLSEIKESFCLIRPKLFESKRLIRQLGWFTSILVDESFEDYAQSNRTIKLQRYDISGEAWTAILKELQLMGISGGNLFDSLDGIAEDIKFKYIVERQENF